MSSKDQQASSTAQNDCNDEAIDQLASPASQTTSLSSYEDDGIVDRCTPTSHKESRHAVPTTSDSLVKSNSFTRLTQVPEGTQSASRQLSQSHISSPAHRHRDWEQKPFQQGRRHHDMINNNKQQMPIQSEQVSLPLRDRSDLQSMHRKRRIEDVQDEQLLSPGVARDVAVTKGNIHHSISPTSSKDSMHCGFSKERGDVQQIDSSTSNEDAQERLKAMQDGSVNCLSHKREIEPDVSLPRPFYSSSTLSYTPQRKSCDRCFRMKTKCSRAAPGAEPDDPCEGCIRRGFSHDCITSRPDYPQPRITLAKRIRREEELQRVYSNQHHFNMNGIAYPSTPSSHFVNEAGYYSNPPASQQDSQSNQRINGIIHDHRAAMPTLPMIDDTRSRQYNNGYQPAMNRDESAPARNVYGAGMQGYQRPESPRVPGIVSTLGKTINNNEGEEQTAMMLRNLTSKDLEAISVLVVRELTCRASIDRQDTK